MTFSVAETQSQPCGLSVWAWFWLGFVLGTCGMHLIRVSELKNQSGQAAEGYATAKSGLGARAVTARVHTQFMSNVRVCLCVAAGHMWPCKILPTGTRPNMLRGRNGPEYRTVTYIGCVGLCLCASLGHCTLHWLQHHRQFLAAWRFVRNSTCCISTFSSRSGRTVVFGASSPTRLVRIAPCTLGEQLTRCRCIGILIVFVTRHVVRLFQRGAHRGTWTLERAQEVLLQWRFLAYTVIFVSWLVVNVRVLAHCPHGSVIRGFSLGAISGSLAGNMWCTRTSEPS